MSRSCSFLTVTLFRVRQAIRFWQYVWLRRPLAFALVIIGISQRALGMKKAGLNLILRGRRVDNIEIATSIIRKIISSYEKRIIELQGFLPQNFMQPIEKYASRMLILKIPHIDGNKVLEKGVVIFKFTETFIPVYLALDVNLLSKYFRVVLEPSWAGYSIADILVWSGISPEKVIVLSPDSDDFKFLSGLASNLVPHSLGAGDWVNPKNFYNLPDVEKAYDAIYIANYNPAKRVDRFIRAIARINKKHRNFSAALVCAGHGTAQREIRATLDCVSSKANIAFFGPVSQAELNFMLNQSKVNVLLSLKEGANKVLTEGMFSGAAALLLEENVGVKRSNINSHTGKVVPDAQLEDALIWFSEHYKEFSPHTWASSHIAPAVSTQLLAEKLREIELSEGKQWTVGLFSKVNQPEMAYLESENDWLLAKRAELLTHLHKGNDEERIKSFLDSLFKEVPTGKLH